MLHLECYAKRVACVVSGGALSLSKNIVFAQWRPCHHGARGHSHIGDSAIPFGVICVTYVSCVQLVTGVKNLPC